MAEIEFSTDQDRLGVAMIHSFLATETYRVPGISRSILEKCIAHSLCFGVYMDGRQNGFARVVTDFVRYAHLLNIFVLPKFRGRGIGKSLMEHILAHPELSTITRYTLGTRDADGLLHPPSQPALRIAQS